MFGVQATIDMEMEGKVMELKKEKDLLGRRHMNRDNALRKVSNIKSFFLCSRDWPIVHGIIRSCRHRFTFLSRLMPYPMRGHRLLCGKSFFPTCIC